MTDQERSPAFTGSLQQWLDRLVLAEPDDRRMIAIEGADRGLSHKRVVCTRHDNLVLNWLSAFSHLDRTEASHRFQEGSHTRLHQPAELRPAWRTSRCTICHRTVIWASTVAGNAMPVDPDPVAGGQIQLIEHTDPDRDDRPLALVLRTEHEQATAAGPTYQLHASSCARRGPSRRSS
jgi:hypothetical protein